MIGTGHAKQAIVVITTFQNLCLARASDPKHWIKGVSSLRPGRLAIGQADLDRISLLAHALALNRAWLLGKEQPAEQLTLITRGVHRVEASIQVVTNLLSKDSEELGGSGDLEPVLVHQDGSCLGDIGPPGLGHCRP